MDSPEPSMFHQGDLNSGISLAIQQSKVVACFIRKDDDHWSQVWEDYWLANKSQPTDIIGSDTPPLGLVIAEKAVLLKIEDGSQEAGFLTGFVKVETVPCLVVVRNGQVLEKLEGGIAKEEFVSRLMKAVGVTEAATGRTREPELFNGDEDLYSETELVDDVDGRQGAQETETTTEPMREVPPAQQTASTPPPAYQESTPPAANVQAMLSERGRRLEADRLRRESVAKAERLAKANARRKEAEEASAAHNDKGKQPAMSESRDKQQARDAWIYQQKQRKDEAKKERERILAQIENDKQERKAQVARRKEAESQAGGGAYSEMPSRSTTLPARAAPGAKCQLQVRLFDGSSIRGKFDPDADIATAVRTWVKEASPEGGADIPYNFRHIQPPQPARSIGISEEHQSLQELGLVPSATLVLVPVSGATDAYASARGGYLGSVVSAASWAANTAYDIVGGALSYVPGFGTTTNGPYMGGTGDEQEASNRQGASMAGSDSSSLGGGASMRVKSLAEQRREGEGVEFYNGNSSAVKGRKDDEEDKR